MERLHELVKDQLRGRERDLSGQSDLDLTHTPQSRHGRKMALCMHSSQMNLRCWRHMEESLILLFPLCEFFWFSSSPFLKKKSIPNHLKGLWFQYRFNLIIRFRTHTLRVPNQWWRARPELPNAIEKCSLVASGSLSELLHILTENISGHIQR